MRIAIAQIDSTAGALQENAEKIVRYMGMAKVKGCALVVFPEMALTGYPLGDLLNETEMVLENKKLLQKLAKKAKGIAAVVGFVDIDEKKKGEDGLPVKFNAAALLHNERVAGVQHKRLLAPGDVFNEKRFFEAGKGSRVFRVAGKKIGITICGNMLDAHNKEKPVKELAAKGAKIVVGISASLFHAGKFRERKKAIQKHAAKGIGFVFANRVGVQDSGNDVLCFDGESIAANRNGGVVAVGKKFAEQLLVFDLQGKEVQEPGYEREEELFGALVFGLKGYAKKCGFSKAVLGLSGGIDSSVVACIAAKAFGAGNVLGITMPSRHSSKASVEDSKKLAKNLGIEFREIGIGELVKANEKKYVKAFGKKLVGVAAENPQARLRGNVLMTVSNAQGRLLVGTGNRTEIALGYCTLYGDMAGGIEAIGDVGKTGVYALAEYINNAMENPIPESVIEKSPSAELSPRQTDPFDYAIVSPLVDLIVEENRSAGELVRRGYKKCLVERIMKLVNGSQYKRKQVPPIIRASKRAFGMGRAYPIINKWK